jgi:hypothetical protein
MTGETVEIGNETWAKMGDYLYIDELVEFDSDGKLISKRTYPPQTSTQDRVAEEK